MTNNKHTPGPWHVGKSPENCLWVYDNTKEGYAVANTRTYHDVYGRAEREANARLIAAAPDLYEFAKAVCELGESQLEAMDLSLARDTLRTSAALALAAIGKAEGGAA